jgi:uncharacterized protein (TIGR02757 family)
MIRSKPNPLTRERLDGLYRKYNRRSFLRTDPIEFLYRFDDEGDREIAGLVASSLAYGRVSQIQRSVSYVLERLGAPSETVTRASLRELNKRLYGFKHRFTTGCETASLLFGAGRLIREHGTLGSCFASKVKRDDETVLPALIGFTDALLYAARDSCPSLIPRASRGSACKRLNLFIRWMVRKDAVDPGGWRGIPPRKLIVPLDTHMHRIGLEFGLTGRKSADMRTALEITKAFAAFSPSDPVKYDFALTRTGILNINNELR